jgi:murein DD-endopeptidase MepM/ murein hydrolase activator NlpD
LDIMNPFVCIVDLRARYKRSVLVKGLWVLFGYGILSTVFWPQPAASQQTPAAPAPRIMLSDAMAETGDTLLVQINWRQMPTSVRDPIVSFGDQAVQMFPHPAEARHSYAGLVGIGLSTHPGPAKITVTWSVGTQQHSASAVFTIRPGAYGEETLKVDPRHVRPSPEDLNRIRREQAELKKIYTSGSRSRLWQDGFRVPVPGEVNGSFGTRRLFNGELQSQHSGVDFRAQAGDPVHTAGSGMVCLAKDLFYSGNAVIIDHGAGVFTSYSHLSRMAVAVGQRVEIGAVIGLAGATGRATGPHLHWGAKVNNVSVNPLALMRTINLLNAK